MPQTYHGTTIPAGGDLAYGPKAFSDAVDKGNFVCVFATVTERDAWAAPPEGVLSYVVATKVLYEHKGTSGWSPVAGTLPTFATPAERDSQWPNPPVGALAVTIDTGTMWLRGASAWGGLRFASVDVTGALTVGGTVTAGALTAASLTTAGRITAADAVLTTGNLNLPGGHLVGGGGVLLLAHAGGAQAQLSATTLAIIANAGNNWNERALYVQAPLGGIGFHSTSLAQAGSIQLFTSGVTGAGFHFVNGGNSGYFSCHAAAFIVPSSRRYKRDITAWSGDGVAVCQQLVPVSFSDKEVEGPVRLGLIAEDVDPVVPEAVEHVDGEPGGVAYTALIPVLIDAIRRLDDRLAALEAAA